MLKIENLHVSIEGKEILKGLSLDVKPGEIHAIMGPNGSGKSTLSSVIAGNEDYEVVKGNIFYNGENIEDLSADVRANRGIFMSFQYPVAIPGITVTNFIKTAINSNLKARGKKEMPAGEMLKKIREKSKLLEIDSKFLSRSLNEGFSGGEKKRNEIFQMAMLEPNLAILDETDSGLDIDALRIVASGINRLSQPNSATILITHYQRLLNEITPDFVHIMADGKIIKTGNKELAIDLEKSGYEFIDKNINGKEMAK